MPILHDNSFGINLESQEMSFSGSFLTPLEECLESGGSKDKIVQAILVESLLMNSQVVHIQGEIYKTLGTGKSFPTLIFQDCKNKGKRSYDSPTFP